MSCAGILSETNSTMNEGDSSSKSPRYASPPPASLNNGHSYSPPPPAPRRVVKIPEETEPALDFVWHQINTGHSILNPTILKAPVLSNWGSSKSKHETFEEADDNEDMHHLCTHSSSELSLILSYPNLVPPGSPDDVSGCVDDDMPPLPSSIKLSMRTEKKPPLSPLFSMKVYGHCFIPIRHDFCDVDSN